MSEQPPPTPNANADVWLMVLEDMNRRREFGIQKYGTPVQSHNGRDVLRDAYEEALDLCVYLRQAIAERDAHFNFAPVERAKLPGECWCLRCIRDRKEMIGIWPYEACRMIVCSKCGNKRCPHAAWHGNECTRSNEPGQPGAI